jgi:hypothetical protein
MITLGWMALTGADATTVAVYEIWFAVIAIALTASTLAP